MAMGGGAFATLIAMQLRNPRGFTVVEALVAVAMLGTGGAMLAASLTVVHGLRARSLAGLAVADAVADHLGVLARRPCTAADTGGVSVAGGAANRWAATRHPRGWLLIDSVGIAGARTAAGLSAYIACI